MDYWSYKSCKSSPPTNQHPVFYRPDALPVAQPTVSKHWRNKYHIPWTCLPPGVFRLCRWPLIAPVNLGGGLSCLSSALWCQYPTLGSIDYINTTQGIAIGHIYCNVVIPITRYVHIFDIMQPMFVNGMCPGKSLKTSLFSPGKPLNLDFAIPGKSGKMGFECLYEPWDRDWSDLYCRTSTKNLLNQGYLMFWLPVGRFMR